ncbi:MAG: hypothetical protein K9M15_02970 [Candidatus Marinimicrobia bacterium]|nr:hypothetical protein [Candidatus Neomarinimicrobiota bacterium]
MQKYKLLTGGQKMGLMMDDEEEKGTCDGSCGDDCDGTGSCQSCQDKKDGKDTQNDDGSPCGGCPGHGGCGH